MAAQQPPQHRQADAAALAALVAAQAATRAQLTAQAVAHAALSAQQFGAWYDTDAVAEWSATLTREMDAYLRNLAAATDAYLARAVAETIGARRPQPVGTVDVSTLRQGITRAGAYARAADAYRWQQSRLDQVAVDIAQGRTLPPPTLERPAGVAAQRAQDVVELDAQMAVRAQEQANLTAAHDRGLITGWRRVVHPELSATGVCGLCIAAAERIYGPTKPREIHAHCKCEALPVTEANDPGAYLNDQDLYRHAGGNTAAKLKRTRYQVDEHGELGLVLAPKGAKVRTARDVRRDEKTPRRPRTDAEIHDLMRRRREALQTALPTVKDLAAGSEEWRTFATDLERRIGDLEQQLAA